MVGQLAPVDREGGQKPRRYGPEPAEEHRQRKGRVPVAERRQGGRQAVPDVVGQAVGSGGRRRRKRVPNASAASWRRTWKWQQRMRHPRRQLGARQRLIGAPHWINRHDFPSGSEDPELPAVSLDTVLSRETGG